MKLFLAELSVKSRIEKWPALKAEYPGDPSTWRSCMIQPLHGQFHVLQQDSFVN